VDVDTPVSRAQRNARKMAVMFIDLDRFKVVNDAHGHGCGDALLQAVARRLRQAVRGSDLLCRHGGDEFVLMIPVAPDCQGLWGIAAKLLASLDAPYPELPPDVRISASVGVARWPDHAADADGLLEAADNAMYAAKQHSTEPPAIAVAEPLSHPDDPDPMPSAVDAERTEQTPGPLPPSPVRHDSP